MPDHSEPADTRVHLGPQVTGEAKPIASAPTAVLPRAEPGQGRGIGFAGLGAAIYLAIASLLAIRLAASVAGGAPFEKQVRDCS